MCLCLSSRMAAALAVCVLVSACSDGVPPPSSDLGPSDVDQWWRRDFGTDQAVGTDLGDEVDLGPATDLGGNVDMGDGVDIGTASDLGIRCMLEPAITLGSENNSVPQRPALAAAGVTFGVVWRERRDIRDDLWMATFTGTSRSADLRLTTDAAGDPVSSVSRAPALAADGGDFVAAWVDNRTDADVAVGNEIWTRSVSATAAVLGAPLRVTDEAGSADSPALASDGGVVLGWISASSGSTTREAFARTWGASPGVPQRLSAPGGTADGLSLFPGTTNFLATWINGDTGIAEFVKVAANGAPDGSPTTHIAALSVTGARRALVVQTASPDLIARPLSSAGALVGTNVSLTGPSAIGRDGAAAAFSGGTAVVYRRATGSLTELVLATLDTNGSLVDSIALRTVTAVGGPPSVAVNSEGDIMVAWADVDAGVTTVYAQAVRCM